MRLRRFFTDCAGFTLTELLVVIVIIGILAGLTIPKYMNTTTKAKATEAKLMLKEVYNLQRTHFLEHDTYATTLDALGFEQEVLKTEGGTARYMIEIEEVTETGFTALATSVIDFDRDGAFNVWAIDQRGILTQQTAD